MVSLATAGRRVVRLKGGDPMIFGRADEEIAACRAAGIPVEVVPGVTTPQGAASRLEGFADAPRRSTARAIHHRARARRKTSRRYRLGEPCRSVSDDRRLYAGANAAPTCRRGHSRRARSRSTPLSRSSMRRGRTSASLQPLFPIFPESLQRNRLPDLLSS